MLVINDKNKPTYPHHFFTNTAEYAHGNKLSRLFSGTHVLSQHRERLLAFTELSTDTITNNDIKAPLTIVIRVMCPSILSTAHKHCHQITTNSFNWFTLGAGAGLGQNVVGPLNTARGSGEHSKLPLWGLEPQRKSNFVHLALKSDIWWHPVS